MSVVKAVSAMAALGLLAGCGGGGGVFNRERPNEFAVTKNMPLVIPPDFALAPPKPGAPRPQEVDSQGQAMQALFGGQAPRSAVEADVVDQAGSTEAAVRSTVGDPDTTVVNKGAVTRDVLAAPEGQGPDATVTTPQ